VIWGIVGMLVGVSSPRSCVLARRSTSTFPWLTYSRLRPLHTNAVIFAFGGSALFATSYYIVQRTCHVALLPMARGLHVLGLAAVIVLAAITLPLGITRARNTPSSSGRSTC
jgi:cytochrome c oxidase cbb3-type subunit 1